MNKSTIIALALAALIAVPAFNVAQAAPGTGEAESSAAPSGPGTGDPTSSAAPSAPSTGDDVSSAAPSAPSTGDSVSSAGPGDTDSDSDDEDAPRRRGSGGSRVSTTIASNTNVVVVTDSCPLITSYLKIDGLNDATQVAKLQAFLKNSQELDVDVNGQFDLKTEAAVKSFQTKYSASILGPWGASDATGVVYITTLKKINELACATPITLSADEQAIIAAYKQGVTASSDTEVTPTDTTIPGSLDVGSTDEESNVAAVGETSIASRFWNFIKNLFR